MNILFWVCMPLSIEMGNPESIWYFPLKLELVKLLMFIYKAYIEGWAQDYGNSNIFLKPLFRGNLDSFVNNANLGAIAHTSNGT